ncbi:hypothetical protein MRX96_014331 [Rhipicephalus microplus]
MARGIFTVSFCTGVGFTYLAPRKFCSRTSHRHLFSNLHVEWHPELQMTHFHGSDIVLVEVDAGGDGSVTIRVSSSFVSAVLGHGALLLLHEANVGPVTPRLRRGLFLVHHGRPSRDSSWDIGNNAKRVWRVTSPVRQCSRFL